MRHNEALSPPEVTGIGHYVHENTRAYCKFGRIARSGMSMILNGLSLGVGCGAGKREIKK